MHHYLGKKIGMTQIFSPGGEAIPVTLISVEENRVLARRGSAKNGVSKWQVGLDEAKKEKRKFKLSMWKTKSGKPVKPPVVVREFPVALSERETLEPGARLPLPAAFANGVYIDVQGVSTGKGFQGVMKRHGMGGGRSSHGSHFHRAPGSIGNCSFPARVHKGKKMAGRMGGGNVTVQNLQIVKLLAEEKILLVKGAVPGKRGNVLFLKTSVKKR